MTTQKRIDGDYVVTTLNSFDNVIVDTHTLEVRGNLDVVGNLTYINVDELNIRDPFIILNSSNTSTYAANSGVLTHQTDTTFAGIRYNEPLGIWELSSNTSSSGETGTWVEISTGGNLAAGGANTDVQFNDAGSFGGNSNFSFDFAVSRLTLQGHEVFGNIGTAPAAVANSVAVYHNAEGSGGTGLYIRSTATQDELVSRSKAIVFSIIF